MLMISVCIHFLSLFQYVLAVGSSVFHAMFYGELAEDKDEIRIPDVEPPSFLAMLKYDFQSLAYTVHSHKANKHQLKDAKLTF